MAGGHPRLVPASLLRLRCFINTDSGLKVKPWASAGETLDAFHDLLLTKRADEAFWSRLAELLEKLSGDLRRRMDDTSPVVDNEVLDPATHAGLLAEIRRTLDGRHPGRGGFRRLASSLSIPAVGILCILGGAVTVGCESETNLQGNSDADADVVQDTVVDTAVDTYADPDLPDETACPHEGMTISQLIAECVTSEPDRTAFEECIDGLHSSWSTGLANHFECSPCFEVDDDLRCLIYWGMTDFCDPDATGEFSEEDLQMFLDNCGVLLYLGVRFE